MFISFPTPLDRAFLTRPLRSSGHFTGRVISRNTEPSRHGPALWVGEDDESFLIEADLPGQDSARVEIEIDDNIVRISGTRLPFAEESAPKKEIKTLLSEQWSGEYSRILRLPETVDANGITRDFQSGLLRLRLPKKTPSARVKLRLEDIPQTRAA